jgi:hypothetical protein
LQLERERRGAFAAHVTLCGLSPPDTAPASLLLSLLSPSLLALPLVALLLLLLCEKPPLLLLPLLPSSLLLPGCTYVQRATHGCPKQGRHAPTPSPPIRFGQAICSRPSFSLRCLSPS